MFSEPQNPVRLLVACLFGLLCLAGCDSSDNAKRPGADVASAAETIIPEGEYRCYLHRGDDDAAPAFEDDDYQGYLNILPGRRYEWKLDQDTRGEFEIEASSGDITWLSGLYAQGRNKGRYFLLANEQPVLLIRPEPGPAAPVGLDCRYHHIPGAG